MAVIRSVRNDIGFVCTTSYPVHCILASHHRDEDDIGGMGFDIWYT